MNVLKPGINRHTTVLYYRAILHPEGETYIGKHRFKLLDKEGQIGVHSTRDTGVYILKKSGDGIFSIHVEAPLPDLLTTIQKQFSKLCTDGKALVAAIVWGVNIKIFKLTSGPK